MPPTHSYLVVLALALSGCLHGADVPETSTPHLVAPTARQSLEIAQLLEARGETLRAQQYLQMAQRQGVPARAIVPRLLRMYIADRQYRLAVEEAEAYLRRHPGDDRVRVLLANLYAALGHPTQAVEQFERALARAPRDAEAHFALATTLHDAGRERLRADTHFRAYLALRPHGPYAEEARSLLLAEVQELP